MAPREIYDAVHSQPFVPFRIVMTDGKTYDIKHPEFCAVGVRTTFVFLPSSEDPALFDRSVRLDNLHIIRMEPLGTLAV